MCPMKQGDLSGLILGHAVAEKARSYRGLKHNPISSCSTVAVIRSGFTSPGIQYAISFGSSGLSSGRMLNLKSFHENNKNSDTAAIT